MPAMSTIAQTALLQWWKLIPGLRSNISVVDCLQATCTICDLMSPLPARQHDWLTERSTLAGSQRRNALQR